MTASTQRRQVACGAEMSTLKLRDTGVGCSLPSGVSVSDMLPVKKPGSVEVDSLVSLARSK